MRAASLRRCDVAAYAGVSEATVDRLRSGDWERIAKLKLEDVAAVAVALGVAPAELVPLLVRRPRGGLLAERGLKREA